jgi:surfeit locus 1 family protein
MSFRFRPGLAAAAALAFAALCALGVWQLQRLEWKRALIADMRARLDAPPIAFDAAAARQQAGEAMDYQPVFIDGVYAHDLESFVFGTYEGEPGVYVFTPLDAADPATGGRRFVYVNRGFAPQRLVEAGAPAAWRTAGAVRVEGLFRRAEQRRGLARLIAPKDQPQDNLYFIRDPVALARRHGVEAPPHYIDSSGREHAGLWPKGGVTRLDLPNRHLGYALTWFGLAAALLAVFVAYSMKRR